MYLISTPSSNRRVAKVWRKVCGVTGLLMPEEDESFLIIARTDCVDKGKPRRLEKKYSSDEDLMGEWSR